MKIREKVQDFLQVGASAYVILTGAVLPLYMKDKMVMIGDAKYFFYRNTAFLFVFVSFVLTAVLLFAGRKEKKQRIGWSVTDSFAVLFGLSMLLSYLFSDYKKTALFGYADWHMGLVTQLLLVWSYFFVSRFFSREKAVWVILGLASTVVAAIGVLNRYQYDPLGCFQRMDYWEWNRLNLLSTIGNINWYAGYLCLTLPLVIFLLWGGKGAARFAGAAGSLIGLVSLFTQGSLGGYIGVGGSLLALLFFSLKSRERLRRFIMVLLLLCAVPVLIIRTVPAAPRGLQLPETAVVSWKGWGWLFLLFLLLYAGLAWYPVRKRREEQKPERKKDGKRKAAIAGAAVFLIFGAGLCVRPVRQLTEECFAILSVGEWGSGRSVLWKAAIVCFLEGDWKQRLIGAGPDCFANIAYAMYDIQGNMQVTGQWEGAVFANAHNEWLNMLVTGGIFGAVSYLGIFCSTFCRCGAKAERHPVLILGIMMAAGYCAYDIFSFQQIVTAPAVFAVLGMMESYCREKPVNADK